MLHFQPFQTFFVKNRNASSSNAATKSCTKVMTCILQIFTNVTVKKGMGHKKEQNVSFGRTMMQALEML